jgi:hemoglobin-like flavoprotein
MRDYDQIFEQSFARALGEGAYHPYFTGRFYEHFLASSPEIAARFASTDMSAQKTMLHDSLHILLTFNRTRVITSRLRELAEIHSERGRAIPAAFYAQWLDSLLQTVSEFDPQFDTAVALAWRLALAPGIALMQFGYDQPLPGEDSLEEDAADS